MFHEFQKFLPKAAAEYNFTKQLQAVQVCQEFRTLSKKIFPPEASTQTFPVSYDGKTLTVGVLNSAWAQQIAMQKHQILEAINLKYGPQTLQNVRIEMTDHFPDL
jgi:predicted nucleic acid-binding Zn ribbon protein